MLNAGYVPDTQKEAEDIRLLLFVQLADILVGTHLARCGEIKSVSPKNVQTHPDVKSPIHPLPSVLSLPHLHSLLSGIVWTV